MQVAVFLGLQLGDAVRHPSVRIHNGARTHIHGAARLKGVVIEVKEHLGNDIRRIVDVDESLLPGIAVVGVIKVHIDGAVDALLPGGLLGVGTEAHGQGY